MEGGIHRVSVDASRTPAPVPKLVDLVRTRIVDPTAILTQKEPLVSAIDACKAFDRRETGWTKVMLRPAA